MEPRIKWGYRSPIPHGRSILSEGHACQYSTWNVQKLLKQSRCHLGYGLGWTKESCITWGPDPPCEGAVIRGKGMPGHARWHCAMICAKMAEPIDLPFVWVVDSGGLKEAQVQSYLPYDWTVHLWQQWGLMSNYFNHLFQYGDLPSYASVWTTHEEHLMVFIFVKNLVGIDAVILIIMQLFTFCKKFGSKMPIRAPFWGFLGTYPVSGKAYQQNPQRQILVQKESWHASLKLVYQCNLYMWREVKTKKETLQYQVCHSKLRIGQDRPRCQIKMKICMGSRLGLVPSFKFDKNHLSDFRDGGQNLLFRIALVVCVLMVVHVYACRNWQISNLRYI